MNTSLQSSSTTGKTNNRGKQLPATNHAVIIALLKQARRLAEHMAGADRVELEAVIIGILAALPDDDGAQRQANEMYEQNPFPAGPLMSLARSSIIRRRRATEAGS